jgi:hypothetical protein
MRISAPPPSVAPFFSLGYGDFLQNADKYAEPCHASSFHRLFQHIKHQEKGYCLYQALQYEPAQLSSQVVANRACWLRIRRRNAGRTAVHKNETFYPHFFPDPLGSARQTLLTGGPYSCFHLRFAIARLFLHFIILGKANLLDLFERTSTRPRLEVCKARVLYRE